jgi:hypothetical protein
MVYSGPGGPCSPGTQSRVLIRSLSFRTELEARVPNQTGRVGSLRFFGRLIATASFLAPRCFQPLENASQCAGEFAPDDNRRCLPGTDLRGIPQQAESTGNE